jgi:chaperonin GroES
MKPISNYILIEPTTPEARTASGLVLPGAQERPVKGMVLAAGPGARTPAGSLIPMEVKVGDTVLYGQFAGTDVKVDGKDLLMIREQEILAVL